MPSCITHQLIAEEAKKHFPQEAERAASAYPDEFFLGCQGPDVFFFYRIGNKSEYNLGKFMHRFRVYDIFSLFLNAVTGKDGAPNFEGEKRMRALSYILGFITHYAADCTFHPFVYRYLEEHRAEKREHQQMENDWDVWFLRELRGQEAEKFRFGFSPKEIVEEGALSRLYAYLGYRLEREEVSKARFDSGVKNFYRYLKFFHGKCYSAQRGWERTERLFHAKRYLSRLFPREDPAPEYVAGEHFSALSGGCGGSADELFRHAVEESSRLVELFLKAMHGEGTLAREDFGNGLLTGKPVD